MSAENPGNMNLLVNDELAASLHHGVYLEKHAGMQLFRYGLSSQVAMVYKQQIEGQAEDEDWSWQSIDLLNFNLSVSQQEDVGFDLLRLRTRYKWHWLPRDWNAISIGFGTRYYDQFAVSSEWDDELYAWSGAPAPVIAGVDDSDPLTWPVLPGSVEKRSDYLAGPDGVTWPWLLRRTIRQIRPSPQDLGLPFVQSESDGISSLVNFVPLPPAERLAWGEWRETDGRGTVVLG